MTEPKRYFDTTINHLDHKGNGQAVVWRENEQEEIQKSSN